MAIPGKGHENIGEGEQQNRRHANMLPNLELPLQSQFAPGRALSVALIRITFALQGQCRTSAIASRMASNTVSIWPAVPIVIRTHPSHPGFADESRTSTPRRCIDSAKAFACAPIRTRTKFV